MATLQTIPFKIYRFNPELDTQPYMQDFTLEVPVGQETKLLKAMHLLHEQDPTLAYRYSCQEGVCGSDGMNINGKNGLACITDISTLKHPITIRPLPGFPVVRDLVVDMSSFYQQYERIDPYLQNDQTPPTKERLQSPEERAALDGLYECILCACCTSSCPSFWWNPDKFIGPAGLLQALRFIIDSRDTATDERLDKLEDPFSVFRCRSIMNCVSACPKGLNPTQAIGKIRKKLIERKT
jgi:succinate dehydrogenase iron-sulfur subunit